MDKSEFIIREYRESDLEGILDLWENHSGWGRPGEVEFKKWMKTPFGDCYIVVAENHGGGLAGQVIFTPTEVYVKGVRKPALKTSAPIIRENLRTDSLLDPDSLILHLIIKGYEITTKKGYDWLYSFPAYGWIRLIRNLHHFGLNKWRTESYPCLEIEDQETASDFNLKLMDDFSGDISGIWENFRNENGHLSFLTRDISWLRYKWGDDLKIKFLDTSGIPAGYAVIKPSSGLLEDFVMSDFSMIPGALVQLSGFWKKYLHSSGKNPMPLKFMDNEVFRWYTSTLKTKSVDFRFAFAISSFETSDLSESLDMTGWYVFPND